MNTKREHYDFFVTYTWSILLKYSKSILKGIVKVYLQYTSRKYSLRILKVYLKYTSKFTLKCWFNFTKCASNVRLLLKQHRRGVYFFFCNSIGWGILEVYLKYTWSIFEACFKYTSGTLRIYFGSILPVYLKYT